MFTLIRFTALLLIVTSPLLHGCCQKEPVKIGFLGTLSGRNADLGTSGLNGVTLAIEKANASGGTNGVPFELHIKDDCQNPEVAVKQVEELQKSGVRIIIGPMTSSIAAAVIPAANKYGITLLSPTVSSSGFTGKDDQFLRVCGTTGQYAAQNARYHHDKLGRRRAAIIYDQGNSAYSDSWLSAFTETFTARGGKVAATVAFTSGRDQVFLNMARKTLASAPDLVVIIANDVDASSITQQLRKLKPGIPISLAGWASSTQFIELAGSYAEGVHISETIDRNNTSPLYRGFLQEYRKRFGKDAGFPAVAGYDAAMVAMTALSRKDSPFVNPKEAIIAIGKFQGLQTAVTIDRFGDSERPVHLSIIRNGKYLPVN